MRIDWNIDGFKEVRYSSEVAGLLEEKAEDIAARAEAMDGGHYAVGSRPGAARPSGRHRASVVTADYKAIRGNAKHNTLLKALGGGGG